MLLPLLLLSFKLVTSLNHVEFEVFQHLQALKDHIDSPITKYLSKLSTEFDTLATNFTIYQLETSEVIEQHTRAITTHLDSIDEIFIEFGIDLEPCEEIFQNQMEEIVKLSIEDADRVIIAGIIMGHTLIAEARNVFTLLQNKTVDVRLEIENCMSLFDSSECLTDALVRIITMQYTLPKIVESVGGLHEEQMGLVEDDVVYSLEKIVVKVTNSYRRIMNEFIVCSTRQYL